MGRRNCSSKFYPCRLNINGDPILWEKLGFHVENSVIALGEMSVHLYDKPTPFRLLSFFNSESDEVTGVDDIPVIVNKVSNTAVADHPNGVYGVDHIVLVSPDASAAEEAFAEMGIAKKKQMQQGNNTLSFYRPSNVTIEVITPPKGSSETNESTLTVVGITFVCKDLENLRKRYRLLLCFTVILSADIPSSSCLHGKLFSHIGILHRCMKTSGQ